MQRIITQPKEIRVSGFRTQDSSALRLTLCALWLAFCVLWLVVNAQPVTAGSHSNNISLSAALEMMERARTHSGYDSTQMEKCLFPYIATICDNWDNIPSLLRDEYSAIFSRPDDPQSWWYQSDLPRILKTPHFVFHYTTTGPDAVFPRDVSPINGVPDFVDLCAESYEKSYREIAKLGYKLPYDDFWMEDNGGDERYDVYMFSGPWLGFTMPEFPAAVQSTVAVAPFFFGINSRAYEYFGVSEGENYVETTCAHEYFHAVEFRYNLYMYRWFMEASSTWIERIVYDGSEQGETDANDYYRNQLRYWFNHPDWSLTLFDGWHEYGDVIWDIFLTERYDVEIIRELFEDMTEGSYRELANFYDVFESRGTSLSVAFKEFTLWNYFTNYRHDDRFYSRGADYPPIAIHLDNIHREYPVKVEIDIDQAPEHLGARYIRFLPAPGQETLSIKVDGSDVIDLQELQSLDAATDLEELDRLNRELDYLDIWGTRGWGAKLVIHRKGRPPKPDEILLFQISQEGQRNFTGFGTDIQEVVLILSNLHPDLAAIQSVSYSAGQQPYGQLSVPKLTNGDGREIYISWELIDLSGIKEIAIVRKRFAPSEFDEDNSPIRVEEVYSAPDLDINGIPDGNINIVGKVAATDTVFVDTPIYFDSGRYYYAVVPVSEYGIMGTPAIDMVGIAPRAPAPEITITTQALAPGEWQVSLYASQPLNGPPILVGITPDGRRIPIELSRSAEGDQVWQGTFTVGSFPPTGTYTYVVSAEGHAGSVGTVITEGGQFHYASDSDKKSVSCTLNPFNPNTGEDLKFLSSGFKISKISIFTIAGELVKELSNNNKWDGTNKEDQTVASGIYIYLAEGDGVEITGKIAVMR